MNNPTQLQCILLRPSKTPRGKLLGYEIRYLTSDIEEGEYHETGIFGNAYYQTAYHPVQLARELQTAKLYELELKIQELEEERAMVKSAVDAFIGKQTMKTVDVRGEVAHTWGITQEETGAAL